MEEMWKEIRGHPQYQVSNKGQIKSFKRYKEGKILVPRLGKDGYLFVTLYEDAKGKNYKVHRLVLMTFSPIDNMCELTVNHKDENKLNNSVENLEWLTLQENLKYGTRKERQAQKMAGVLNRGPSRKIVCIETGQEFPSIAEASRQTGISLSQINRCLRQNKTAYNKHFVYKEDF